MQLSASNEMKRRIEEFDWSSTPVGPMEAWPTSLKCAVDIITASPVPMVLLWGPQGIMIYNDGYAAFAGSRHPELLGMPIVEAWPEAADFNRRVLECGLAGEALSFRDKHFSLGRRGTPEDVWTNLDYSPVRGEDGNPAGVLAIVVDTTPWVYAERAQRESESRFRTLADNIAAFAWMADEAGNIFWYNKRWFDYTGPPFDEAKQWGWPLRQHPDHVDRVMEKINRCLTTGEVWEDTFPLKGRDGVFRWFLSRAMPIRDEAGNVIRWFGTNTDITEHLEEAEKNAQLATIVATSADGIISMSNEGLIQSWNPGAERMFGYTAEEVLGRSERLLFPEGAEEEFEEKYRHLRHGEHVLRDTVRRRKDGSMLDVAINVAPMRRPDGRIFGFSAVFRDITERKRVEKHLRMVMRELSHRTKNLLAVIVAMVRQTARSTSDVAVLQSQLIQRLQSLSASHDLLVAEDWTGASLEELIRAVLQPFIGNSSEALACHGQPVFINATAAQNLGLAMHELATNAAKYGALSTIAGRVRVAWGFEPDEGGVLRLVLRWEERGGPRVVPATVRGFGHVVIERVAGQALNAKVDYQFPPEGVRWTIAMPLEFVVRWRSTTAEAAPAAG
ncbi:MAG: PAS domain S-box protein [Hyphomicrobium sp.]|nr:MAG: PAS domain S-box protein [Hyphomicrobium sp.]